jgi:hypothetical protein
VNVNMSRPVAAMLLAAALLVSSGCLEEPEDPPKKAEESKYGDLTEKEHIIANLLQSYADRNIDRYIELLHADYVWYLQPRDVEPGGSGFVVRQEDINMTRNMFLAANGQFEPVIERMDLEIDPGDWYSMPSIGDKDCAEGECWQTERGYHLVVQIGEMTYIANDIVIVNIVKDAVTEKYSIMSIYDVQK